MTSPRRSHRHGGVQQPPALHHRGHGQYADPLVVLHQHQGTQGLFGRAVRRAWPADRPGVAYSRCISARLLGSVQAVLARYQIDQMRDGDAFVLNDPYLAGGTHMPDISIVTPVFIDGAVRAFAANVGHHSDVGGPVPGSISGRARSVFEEGLRLPVIRLVRGGELDEDLLALIAHNSRDPDERSLDLKVQVAANARGVRADTGTGRPHGARRGHRGDR